MRHFREHGGIYLLIMVTVLVALPLLTYPMGRDQGMYANIGKSILAGGTPYTDMWDIKPPPIYYLYAGTISIFGQTTAAIRALDLLSVPVGMMGLYLVGVALRNKRYGLLAALLYGVFYFNEDFPSLTQNDSLVTIPMIWAVYCALRTSTSSPRTRAAVLWASATGALCGLVLWFKHYFAFFVLALVIYQIASRWYQTRREQTSLLASLSWDVGGFVAGGLATGGTLLLYFWSQGMVQEMLIIAEGTAAYNAQGRVADVPAPSLLDFVYFKWLVWGPLLVLVTIWCLWQLGKFLKWVAQASSSRLSHTNDSDHPLDKADHSEHPSGLGITLLWLVAGLAFVLVQSLGFDTHWIPMLPPLALLGADVLDRLIYFSGKIPQKDPKSMANMRMVVLTLIFLTILAGTTWGRAWYYVTGQEDRVAYYDRFQANDLKPEESLLRVADYLRQRVLPNDTVFVWGFRPEVAYMAQLRPATRYQAQFPLVAPWYPQAWQQDNVDILWAAMPPYALVLEDDFMPWVTSIDADSHTILQSYTELNNWLIANYDRVDEIGDFIIWQRKAP